ncbi:MAG: 3-hydroxyacyl-CoA dehydrogenase family protein [Candidatus Velthaea sp.]
MRMAVIGPGTIGTHVALLGIRNGVDVVVVGRDAERTRSAIAAAVATTGEPVDPAAVRVSTTMSAAADCDLIYEAIHERLAEKREIFRQIEEHVGFDVPIVSGTSSISPADLGRDMRHPDRIFVAHFVHPVTTVALAEVLEPAAPNSAARATFEHWIGEMQLEPMVLERAVPGFIVNRLQFALLREAVSLVANGVVDARDIDRVISTALGPRWVATGPLASMDIAGLQLFRDVAKLLAPTLENGTMVDHLTAIIDEGRTGAAAGAGMRTWKPADLKRASDARKRSYAFAKELHAGGMIPNDDPH